MLINCQCQSAKVAPNLNRVNFASNNLEYKKLKAFTLTLMKQIAKHIATLCVNYAFQNLRDILR